MCIRDRHYRAAWTRLNALPQVDEISMMTHFSDADGDKGVQHQMQIFKAQYKTCQVNAVFATARPLCASMN